MLSSLVVPVDGSNHAITATRFAGDLAGKYGARVTLVHFLLRHMAPFELQRLAESEGVGDAVKPTIDKITDITTMGTAAGVGYVEPVVPVEALRTVGEAVLDHGERVLREAAGADLPVDRRLQDGDPANGIVALAEESGADAIVMGSRGLSALQTLLVGSVSHKVQSHAACTVIAVK